MKKVYTERMRSGFTLVELLVVISIIAILSAVVIVNYSSARSKARDTKRQADLLSVQSALELYYADQKKYPEATPNQWLDISSLGISDYLQPIPKDPKNSIDYQYAFFDHLVGTCQPPFYVLKAIAEKSPTTDTCYNVSGEEGIYVVGGR